MNLCIFKSLLSPFFTGQNLKFWYRWKEETPDFYKKWSHAQLPTKKNFRDARGLAPFSRGHPTLAVSFHFQRFISDPHTDTALTLIWHSSPVGSFYKDHIKCPINTPINYPSTTETGICRTFYMTNPSIG